MIYPIKHSNALTPITQFCIPVGKQVISQLSQQLVTTRMGFDPDQSANIDIKCKIIVQHSNVLFKRLANQQIGS